MGDPEFLNAFPKLAALPKEQKRDGVRLLLSFNYTDGWISILPFTLIHRQWHHMHVSTIVANPILFEKLVDESVARKRSARGIGNQAAAAAQWYLSSWNMINDVIIDDDTYMYTPYRYIMDDDKTAIDARKQELKTASATCPVLLIHGTADRVLPSVPYYHPPPCVKNQQHRSYNMGLYLRVV